MRTLSAAAIQAIMSETTSECFVWLIKISHADITTMYFTDNPETVTSNGNDYIYWPFTFSPPEDKNQNIHSASISISNIDPDITAAIRSLSTAPVITVSMVLPSDPNTILYGPVDFTVDSSTITRQKITANIREKNVFLYSVPWPVYTATAFPGFTR